jgi:hypothetical protein
MRILEACIDAWPMLEMKAQIDALREAFSADKNKPFELKESFPYGTPSDYHPSPPLDAHYHRLQVPEHETYQQQPRSQSYSLQTMTPPVSAISRDSGFDSPMPQHSRGIAPTSNLSRSVPTYSQSYPQQAIPTVDEAQWNPTPIFHQWNTAFSIPQAALAPPSSATSNSPPMTFPVMQQTPTPVSPSPSNPYMTSHPTSASGSVISAPQRPQRQQQPQTIPSQPAPGFPNSFVTSKQWQQSVASVFDPEGLKRRWRYSDIDGQNQPQPPKRMR